MSKKEFSFLCKAVHDMYLDSEQVPITKKYVAHLSMGKNVSMVLNSSQIAELRTLLFHAQARMANKQTLEILVEQQKNNFYLN